MEIEEKIQQGILKEEYRLPSSDKRSALHVIHWRPEGEVKAVLQISHGMIEHIGRYDDFARFLAARGIAVIGHDHLGHGKSSHKDDYGFFADRQGDICMVRDLRRVRLAAGRKYPGLPYILLGHSMGSFFLRKYMTVYGKTADGVIILGTGDEPLSILLTGRFLVDLIGHIRGWRYRSPFLHNLVLGNFDRKFKPVEDKSEWLTRDREKVHAYSSDPMCSFYFTCSAYRDFFNVMLDLKKRFWLERISKDTPILLMSGEKDPVGGCTRGVKRVYKSFKKVGIRDVQLKFYPECRHELLNERNRKEVYLDIIQWIGEHIDL